jgi:N-acetylmuramic acid 6-phosphate etherase
MTRATQVLAFDVGKTGCRGARYDGGQRLAVASSPGGVGIAERHGVQAAVHAVAQTAHRLGADRADCVSVGLAGLSRARHKAEDVADALFRLLGADEVVLAGDMVTSHAGALAGAPGVVVAAGTGAVALGIDTDGRSAVCDGWGYLLGDDGSGYAVGRAGLASALRHHDGRDGSALLHRLAGERYGDLDALPGLVHGAENPAREVAAFAADVRAAAEQGDDEAARIWQQAGRALARCAAGAAHTLGRADVTVTTTGGLFGAGALLSQAFEPELRRLLPQAHLLEARGDALDGAALLTGQRSLPHEPLVVRFAASARPAAAVGSGEGLDLTLGQLETEAARPDLADLDTLSSAELVAVITREDAGVPPAVARVADAIAAAVDVVVERLGSGGRLVYVGAGTSGRLAVLDAAELLPTYGVGDEAVVALMAGGDQAVLESVEGAEDDEAAAERDLAALDVGPDDVVVGIAASGRTPYVLGAADAARKAGAFTVGIAGNRDSELGSRVDLPIEVLTGPEVVAGSTRMKAGTAQKLVLNTISTASMVRLGKVYGNRMVDMRATNAKLRRRARRIVGEATGADAPRIEATLEAADGQVKTAIVALLAGVDVAQARRRLDRAGGSVRAAVEQGGDA